MARQNFHRKSTELFVPFFDWQQGFVVDVTFAAFDVKRNIVYLMTSTRGTQVSVFFNRFIILLVKSFPYLLMAAKTPKRCAWKSKKRKKLSKRKKMRRKISGEERKSLAAGDKPQGLVVSFGRFLVRIICRTKESSQCKRNEDCKYSIERFEGTRSNSISWVVWLDRIQEPDQPVPDYIYIYISTYSSPQYP